MKCRVEKPSRTYQDLRLFPVLVAQIGFLQKIFDSSCVALSLELNYKVITTFKVNKTIINRKIIISTID